MGKITVIYQNGEVLSSPCSSLPLVKMQEMVGGYVQRVPMFQQYEGAPCVVYCDEEGKMKGGKVNAVATNLWYDEMHRQGVYPPFTDSLVGAVLIVQGADLIGKL